MKASTKIRKLYNEIKDLKKKLETSITRRGRHHLRQEILELEYEIREIKKLNIDEHTD
jgi:DNA repair ATPase RecN